MPQKRKSMKQIRRIIQLRLNDESMSIRTISAATRVSRPVVKQYLDLLKSHPIDIYELESMSDEKLRCRLGIIAPTIIETDENKTLISWLKMHNTELSKVGVTRLLLHERYREEHPNGLQYTQFCFVFNQHYQGSESSSLFDHKAGDKMYLDFTGEKLHWFDSKEKEYVEEIFVAVLGASALLYSVPIPSQKMHDFCYATEQSFHFFGGIPRAVVPDCLKSAVLTHDGHQSVLNPLFARLMEHYGTVCIPARPRRPKDKPYAENSVTLVYRQILARMDGQRFDTRIQMLEWWFEALKKINNTPFQKLSGTRQSRFDTIEKQTLKPLALTRFDLSNVLSQTVTTTGVIYIPDDKTSYSVPFSLIGEKVEILIQPGSLQIWHDGERKAVHTRQKDAGKIIRAEHRSHNTRWYADRNHTELLRELTGFGVHIASMATKFDILAGHEDLSWQHLTGLRQLYIRQPDRLDTACRIALKQEEYTLRSLKRILKDEEDLLLTNTEQQTTELPFHENIRGPEYFQYTGMVV